MKIQTLLLLSSFTLLLSACVGSSKPAVFYNMTGISEDTPTIFPEKTVKIGVLEAKIPSYIDKPQIVLVDKNDIEVRPSEFNRWSEPLPSLIQRTMAEDLSIYLPNSIAKVKNYSREDFDYYVTIEVNRLDATLGQQANLDVWWSIFDPDTKTTIAKGREKLQLPIDDTYKSIALAQSHMLGKIAYKIADDMPVSE